MTDLKRCSGCGEEKPRTSKYFHRAKSSEDGLQGYCKLCAAEYGRAYRNQHPAYMSEYARQNVDQKRALSRKWYENNRERHLETSRRWQQANREKLNERARRRARANPEASREQCRRWRVKFPDKVRAYTQRRRAALVNAEGFHTADDIRKQFKSQHGKCWWCGVDCSEKYHVDHRIPLTKGGTNWPSNLVIACPTCNISKHNKLPYEFAGRLL